MKKILVLGAGGFIGSHLANRLAAEGNNVTGADIKKPMLEPVYRDFLNCDVSNLDNIYHSHGENIVFDEIYQLAANMGGAGFVFTGENDAEIMRNSALINLTILEAARLSESKRIFFSSSACIYKENPNDPKTSEDSAYPAMPDSNYGWEKLFSERLYQAYAKNYGIETRVARYHNIFGPYGCFEGGREKAPAAICRKVAESRNGDCIELWGDGTQLRSFLYVDECVEGTIRLMRSDFSGPVNLGSEEMVSLDTLAKTIIGISSKNLDIRYVPGPIGVNGRNSDNTLLREKLGWAPSAKLIDGLRTTYAWIEQQVKIRPWETNT